MNGDYIIFKFHLYMRVSNYEISWGKKNFKNLPMNLPDIDSWPGPQSVVSTPRKK